MNKVKIAVFLALAGAGLSTQTANAGVPGSFTYASGDVLIGFSSTSSSVTTDYLIDVNNAITHTAPGTTITLGTYGSDLTSFFDSSWFTSGNSRWGVIGTQLAGDASGTLYVGAARTSASATAASAVDPSYYGRTLNSQNATGTSVTTVGGAFNSGTADSSNNVSTAGDTGTPAFANLVGWDLQNAPNAQSWNGQSNAALGLGFSQFVGFQGAISASSFGDSIDFYQIAPSVTGANTDVLEGTFNVNSNGTITYTQAIPVPEPSALAALVGGTALLGMLRRRRAVVA